MLPAWDLRAESIPLTTGLPGASTTFGLCLPGAGTTGGDRKIGGGSFSCRFPLSPPFGAALDGRWGRIQGQRDRLGMGRQTGAHAEQDQRAREPGALPPSPSFHLKYFQPNTSSSKVL